MSDIKATASHFFEACETGKGWEGCQAFCHPDATFSAQADALSDVEAVLESADSETECGDPTRLKEASGRLDEATKELADLMMDRAMEAMLKKRGIL